jgi:tetratricopeptide (TPR) repeat protein
MILVPLVVLGGIEAVLRVTGYGYNTSVFKEIRIGDNPVLVNNDDFSLRFFSPQVARYLGPIRMAVKKPAGTYRIFILGESAAMGDPDPSYGASRYLDALLSARYPKTHFEIINLGITAINSHVILPIARDCAAQNGDLWIIYMGNNEMVGPFGAATVFGAKAPPVALVRLNLAIQKMRLGQLLINLSRKLKRANTPASSWGGMEMFVGNELSPGDPRKEMVYKNFSKNLDDIIKAGLNSGAKILLNTVAVNLKDCPPFASTMDGNLPPADRIRFGQFFTNGIQAEGQNNFSGAAQDFEEAAKLDPKVAELQFRWGKSLLSSDDLAEAREHLQLACDDDALPFRADSRINGIIRDERKKITSGNLIFCDAATALADGTPEKIPGQETFYEHVHLNFEGNYRLALAWAAQIENSLPGNVLQGACTNAWAGQEICERRLGLSDWNRSLVIESVIQRMQQPPLSSQLDNAERVKMLMAWMNRMLPQMNPATATKTAEDFENTLAQWPGDYCVRENFALFLKTVGDLAGAIGEWRQVHDLIPQDSFASYQLGRLLEIQGQYVEAESYLQEAAAMRPTLADVWVELGNTLALQNDFVSALAAYERAHQIRPQDSQTVLLIGNVLTKLNRHAEAIQNYRAGIKLDPGDWELHFELGGELDSQNQLPEACDEFATAARLNPDSPRTHFNYGVLLAKQERFDEARREFEETISLEPANQKARFYLATLPVGKNQNP